MEEILDTPDPDAVSLWTIASACSWIDKADFCDTGRAHEMLMRADPGNAAVSVMRFGQLYTAETGDLAEIEVYKSLFAQAAEADRFDGYRGKGAVNFFQPTLLRNYLELSRPLT